MIPFGSRVINEDFVAAHPMTVTIDGRAISYRIHGVLLERLPVLATPNLSHHMIPVIRAIRRYFGTDPGFATAKAIWEGRKWESHQAKCLAFGSMYGQLPEWRAI